MVGGIELIVDTSSPERVTLTIEVRDPASVLDRLRRVFRPSPRLVTLTMGPNEVARLHGELRVWLDSEDPDEETEAMIMRSRRRPPPYDVRDQSLNDK